MGGGTWNVGTYASTNAANAAAGRSTFDYSAKVKSGAAPKRVHKLLEPTTVAGPTSLFAGTVMREVCVTDEHPNPTPILIWLDVTGSNITAATVVHQNLPALQAYLKDGKFCDDPQINVSAVGDATSDDFPLQFGQYESDNRLDDQIAALILEGKGGGQQRETYELGAYMGARHVHLEPYDLFGKKGFVFFIGDEMPYQQIENDYTRTYWGGRGHTLESLTGDTLAEPLDSRQVFAELMEKNHVFFLFQRQGAYSPAEIVPEWKKLIGDENVVILDDPAMVVEVIAALVARFESGMSGDDTAKAMVNLGGNATTVASAVKALVKVDPASTKRGRIIKATGSFPKPASGADRI